MSKEIFVKLMNGLGKVYGRDLDQETLEIWLSFFIDNTTNEFKEAINQHIKTSSKFPTIAEIKNLIYENNHDKVNNSELWDKLVKAISRSSYYAEEEFDKLPDIVKQYVRSPYRLQEMASMDSDVINSVEKGIFMKQIENIKQNYKNYEITSKNLLQEKEIYKLENLDD